MTSQDAPREPMPFQPANMTPAQLAAVSFLARYSGPTHHLYAYQLRRWFAWCETNRIDALIGVERAHVELYIRSLTESGLMASSVVALMHGVLPLRPHRRTHADRPSGLRPTTRGASR
ncbi:hypothetical protein QI633_20225 [Nocardioides sp. QY071]|uniref:hypothetical protein n=1 Tax=Nocardioides sp. QY071 TaxID=3044187 RepID=UPI00249A26F4|nr:hypothetical protein [Nocardioides sp. QY071]WGY00854.1 hypothetical protein QI633_20225 [Nocardioides sp. QY071]